MKKIKVLMLGWEFPPIINGGLGVACLGLSKALSKEVDLTLILPKSDPSIVLNKVDIIGLNQQERIRIREDFQTNFYEELENVYTLPANIAPYQPITETRIESKQVKKSKKQKLVRSEFYKPFEIENLYGNDTIQKVIEYASVSADMCMEWNFDVIHCHDWMTMLAGVEIKQRTGKPLVLHVHSLEYDRNQGNVDSWVYQVEKHAMEQADAILPVSNYTGNIAVAHYGINPRKIHSVHNGVEKVIPYKVAKPFPEKIVLFIGRVTHQKGPEYFVEVASKVLKEYPLARFVVAGTGDKLKELIETGAHKHLGLNIHFTGFLSKEKIHDLLAMADVYCMPSVSEPFGLSALEAAQFGVPCVVSKQSGVSEVLMGALKVDFWDIDKMAHYILMLLKDPTFAKTISGNAQFDLEYCTWEHAASEIQDIYKKLLA
jgi:glycogen(starch) synthase